MAAPDTPGPADACHCLAVRQAGRWIGQLYDRHLAGCGLTSAQFSILAQLDHLGGAGIAGLAQAMVMDRTTITRNIAPLERDGLVRIEADAQDGRRKVLALTAQGRAALVRARPHWRRAQAAFEKHLGARDAAAMRDMLRKVPQGRSPRRNSAQ